MICSIICLMTISECPRQDERSPSRNDRHRLVIIRRGRRDTLGIATRTEKLKKTMMMMMRTTLDQNDNYLNGKKEEGRIRSGKCRWILLRNGWRYYHTKLLQEKWRTGAKILPQESMVWHRLGFLAGQLKMLHGKNLHCKNTNKYMYIKWQWKQTARMKWNEQINWT